MPKFERCKEGVLLRDFDPMKKGESVGILGFHNEDKFAYLTAFDPKRGVILSIPAGHVEFLKWGDAKDKLAFVPGSKI